MERAKLLKIFLCPKAGENMQELSIAWVKAGAGLRGDRYAEDRGSWSKSKREVIRHISLISVEAIYAANQEFGTDFLPHETRRNLLTEGIDLNTLVDQYFFVGWIFMKGIELCDPCDRPSVLSHKPLFKEAFANRGGLRAQVLNTGMLQIGDIVKLSG